MRSHRYINISRYCTALFLVLIIKPVFAQQATSDSSNINSPGNKSNARIYSPNLSPAITSFKIFGKERSINADSLDLSYSENFFSFDYTANFINASANKYAYKLEGFDKDWIDAGNRQYVNYTNVPGGNYLFKLRASNDGVHWFEMKSPIVIHIDRPFYKTIWFIILIAFTIVIVAALIIYFAQRVQLERMLMTEKIRNSIASDLHDDIGSSISSIILMSEIAVKQPSQTVNYLSQISETSRKIVENMNDIVWAVNPDNDTMEQMIIRMQQFASSLLEKKNITLDFNANPQIQTLKLGMRERRNFYLIFKETIHNAIKHAACSCVKVEISGNDKLVTLMIQDNGKGFDTAKNYSGNGMVNLQKRAAEINGKIQVLSAPGNGTAVQLSFTPTQTGS